jgi:RNA polymerase sigma-70 factor (ECF subfamily)
MDVDTFKKQYLPLHPKLFRIVLALVGNKEEAEDILQEVYGKLWSRRNELTAINNPEAFAVTLVKNSSFDYLRSSRANRHEEEVDNIVLAYESTPEKEFERQDELAYVKQLIEKLPENQKQVIRLRGLNGCSPEEIAEITGFTPTNVRTLLSRARKVIKEQYEKVYAL